MSYPQTTAPKPCIRCLLYPWFIFGLSRKLLFCRNFATGFGRFWFVWRYFSSWTLFRYVPILASNFWCYYIVIMMCRMQLTFLKRLFVMLKWLTMLKCPQIYTVLHWSSKFCGIWLSETIAALLFSELMFKQKPQELTHAFYFSWASSLVPSLSLLLIDPETLQTSISESKCSPLLWISFNLHLFF